jgi:hypothetical protein
MMKTLNDRVLDIFEQADNTLMIFIREGVNNRPTKVIHANEDGDILSQRAYYVHNNMGLLANAVVADFRRRGDADNDTATGTLRILGFVIEYN